MKALLNNGLKISPKKCQLFRTNLHFMGNEIFIQNKRVCVKALRGKLEAIQKLQPPLQQKDAEGLWECQFSKHVLSIITEMLKPIYDLTRKGRPFVWRKEQQDSFEEIK